MQRPVISKLKKDKAIGAIPGWCDTINWVTDSVSNLKGSDGITIDWGNGSQPTIKFGGSLSGDYLSSVAYVGTDGSTASGGTVTFESMLGSNLSVHVSNNGSGGVTVQMGVFYL